MALFTPGSTSVVNVTAASTTQALDARRTSVRLYNAGPGTVFVKFGNAAASPVASATDSLPLPSGDVEAFDKGYADTVAVISDSTAVLYVTTGEGK